MRIAILSDTHGNLTAFEAVLSDIDTRGIDRIIHLGDVAGKGPRGSACCALARERCETVVRGNWDVFLLRDTQDLPSDSARWWQAELSGTDRTWMSELPYCVDFSLAGTQIRCYHASADDEFHRIYPFVQGDEWNGLFANTPKTGEGTLPDVVIYGDIHHAWSRTVDDHTLINCGSVGNPLDEPIACYVVLDGNDAFAWELVRVPYDIEAELAAARAAAMPEYEAWAHELRTAEYAR